MNLLSLDRNFLSTHSVQIALSADLHQRRRLFPAAARQRTGKTTFPNAACSAPVSIVGQNHDGNSLPAPRTTMWYSRLALVVS